NQTPPVCTAARQLLKQTYPYTQAAASREQTPLYSAEQTKKINNSGGGSWCSGTVGSRWWRRGGGVGGETGDFETNIPSGLPAWQLETNTPCIAAILAALTIKSCCPGSSAKHPFCLPSCTAASKQTPLVVAAAWQLETNTPCIRMLSAAAQPNTPPGVVVRWGLGGGVVEVVSAVKRASEGEWLARTKGRKKMELVVVLYGGGVSVVVLPAVKRASEREWLGVASSSSVSISESKDTNLKKRVLLNTKSKSTSKDVRKSQSSFTSVANKSDTINLNVSE
nr:hypothetical protein [Tanacetum cinerariifolium]